MELVFSFRKERVRLEVDADASMQELGQKLSDATGLQRNTIKVVNQGATLYHLSTCSQSIRASGLIGFEEELLRAARRRNLGGAATAAPKPPSGPHTFQRYEALDLLQAQPPKSEALKLLHRLAADVGIVGIMQQNRFEVGLLSEMPPTDTMDDQRQITCLLGLNINAGQEIKLRLRTDDLKGFRKYDRIRETLVHELTHNVWQDHSNNFKALNSQLLRECVRLNNQVGSMLASQDVYEGYKGDYLDQALERDNARLRVSAESTGLTLRARAGGSAAAPLQGASAAAASAALARFEASHEASTSASATAVTSVESAQVVVDIAHAYEHEDAETSAQEAAMSRLGGVDTSAAEVGREASALSPMHASEAMDVDPSPCRQAVPAPQQRDGSSEVDVLPADSTPSTAQTAAGGTLMRRESVHVEQATSTSDEAKPCLRACGAPSDARGSPTPAVADATCHATSDPAPPRDLASDAQALGMAADDPTLLRVNRVHDALRELEATAPRDRLHDALATVLKIVQNSLQHPGNDRFASVRRSNAAFSQRVAAFPAAERLLQLAGFTLYDGDRWSLGKRQDPGMLWLVSDLIQNRVAQSAGA